ncbi:MAG: hypothetical protein HZA51_08405 [Planctomycetes bacterium]|nr:hypothetical protein [Planctomycetota bacterium]
MRRKGRGGGVANFNPDKRRLARPDDVEIVTVETYHRPVETTNEPLIVARPLWRVRNGAPFALRRRDWVLSVLLAVAAFSTRWPLIERGETLLHPDEAVVGIMAQDIAAGRSLPIYFYGQRYMGALEAYVVAAMMPLFDDPIHALRSAPALFLALFVAAQYLMLTSWFGRRGGLVGAAVLIDGSPMFAQWSISARGGYVEVLLWGTLLLWAYTSWFVWVRGRGVTFGRRFTFGAILGSGFWINPSILFFALPILGHALLARWPMVERGNGCVRTLMKQFRRHLGRATLPLAVLAALTLLNAMWSVWVEDGEVRTRLLFGAATGAKAIFLAVGIGFFIWYLATRTNALHSVRDSVSHNGVMLLGGLVGATPAIWYVIQHVVAGNAMDPALPLGIRPLWKTGETLIYLLCGMPLMFGADPRPYMAHVTVGRDHAIEPFDIFTSSLVSVADRLVLASAAACVTVFIIAYGSEIRRMLLLRGAARRPTTLVVMGATTSVALYLLGGCSCSFTTIRYLLPLWAFIPGLVAAVAVNRRIKAAAMIAPLLLCASWLSGQYAMCRSLGAPHPLRVVADALSEGDPPTATAEILDAHLLSYLTGQSCRVREFEPFWPRLAHYESAEPVKESDPVDYVVNTTEIDRTLDWADPGYPGPPPPETQRSLWPKLKRAVQLNPSIVVAREPLPAGYERIRLCTPIQ